MESHNLFISPKDFRIFVTYLSSNSPCTKSIHPSEADGAAEEMALLLYSAVPLTWEKRFSSPFLVISPSNYKPNNKRETGTRLGVQAFFNPFEDQPIIKDALKEPVAFMGGMFAGLLRLDLNEDPLKEWITRTVEASGIAADGEIVAEELKLEAEEDAPQQIEIE
uniref:UPF0426 protein At1g28150, chloroplastic n=1 Tax=Elaeis guineensis var. tenera TaxID=51953 RepID=A0A6I9R0Z2_ELAGV|nr:UPF0426 protein At1g28150, chloroplastic [Elaeis guineensis]